jgi:NitT/TauT family transport system substrate-binding protein
MPGRYGTAIKIACLAVAACFAGHAATAADKVKISLGANNDAIYLPYFIALDKGYYKDLGIDAEIIFAGGGTATPALMSQTLDFSTSAGSAVSAILKGAPLKIIMNQSETVPFRLWATKPEIKTLQDLKGKVVGIQTRGDLFEVSVRAALLQAGMSGDSVVFSPLGYGGAQRLGVVKSGSMPAVVLSNVEEDIARKNGDLANAHLLVDITKEIHIPYNGVATSEALIAKNPSLVERFVQACLMGVRFMKAQPEASLEIFKTKAPKVDPAILRKSIEETSAGLLDGGMTPLATQKSEIALRSSMMGVKPADAPSPEKVFDYKFVKAAAEKLRADKWTPQK